MKTPVLIVGGGPSGMVAALGLAKLGVKSVIVEKREQLGRHPKAHEVSGRTLEILTSLGIPFRELACEASPAEDASRILFCRTIGEEIGRIDLAEKSIKEKYRRHTGLPQPYLNLSQTELEKTLRKHVLRDPRITFLAGTEWKLSRQNAGGVVSLARRTREGKALEIASEYVIAADGAGGKCREALGIKMQGPEKIQDFANAYFTDDLRTRLPVRAQLFFVFKPDAAGTFIAHHAGKRWVYHVPVMTPYEKLEDYTEEVFTARIRSALGDPAFTPKIESINSWRMTAQVAESFQSGRVFLIGDAAHRFPPTGGLGLNSGVGDAHNLAWKIAAVLVGEAPVTLLATYETERRPVIQKNCDESRDNYYRLFDIPAALGLNAGLLPIFFRVFVLPPLRWLGKKFRARVLSWLFALADRRLVRYRKNPALVAKVRNVIADQAKHFDRIGLDLGYSYAASAAGGEASTATEYRPDFGEGTRLPVFHFNHRGNRKSSHDLISYRHFTMLVPEGAPVPTRKGSVVFGWASARAVTVPEWIDYAGKKVRFRDAAGLASAGAILVRPDGHIAARLTNTAQERSAA